MAGQRDPTIFYLEYPLLPTLRKSAIVENSFNNPPSSAILLRRICGSSAITRTLSKREIGPQGRKLRDTSQAPLCTSFSRRYLDASLSDSLRDHLKLQLRRLA